MRLARRSFVFASILAASVASVTSPARAEQPQAYGWSQPDQPSQPPQVFVEEEETPHTSFHLHSTLGIGYLGGSADYGGGVVTTSYGGAAVMLGFSGGYAILPNLILGGDLDLAFGLAQTYSVDSPLGNGEGDLTATILNFGPSVTYYLMPINLYFTGQLGIAAAWIHDKTRNEDVDLDVGFGMKLGVGYEWIVWDKLGLGVAAFFNFMTLPPDTRDNDYSNYDMFGGTLAFSVSYR